MSGGDKPVLTIILPQILASCRDSGEDLAGIRKIDAAMPERLFPFHRIEFDVHRIIVYTFMANLHQ